MKEQNNILASEKKFVSVKNKFCLKGVSAERS
jgi:hypothetical protein